MTYNFSRTPYAYLLCSVGVLDGLLHRQSSLGLQKAGERIAVHEVKCGLAPILVLSLI
jgi:hypothetical protein